jgi:hypothetical protein
MVHNLDLLSGIKQRAWDFFPIVGTRPKSRAEHGTDGLSGYTQMSHSHRTWKRVRSGLTSAQMRHTAGTIS